MPNGIESAKELMKDYINVIEDGNDLIEWMDERGYPIDENIDTDCLDILLKDINELIDNH